VGDSRPRPAVAALERRYRTQGCLAWFSLGDTGRAMSWENVELVRRMLQAGNRDDLDAALTCFDCDAVWEHNLGVGTPMEGSYRGHQEIRHLWGAILEAFGDYRFEVGELNDYGDQVMALGRLVIQGESSGAPVETPVGIVFDVRARCIVRTRFWQGPGSRGEALEAVGLRE
jgi:ketosteroid isomerase-like protein